MLRITDIKLPIEHSKEDLLQKITRNLRVGGEFEYEIKRRSLDARHKPELYYNYSIDIHCRDEDRVLKRATSRVSRVLDEEYAFPYHTEAIREEDRPVIVGLGPAGLFAGLMLSRNGFAPIILERGQRVEQRRKTVEEFWAGGKLLADSNVQFGEGGAGAFSDGKLNTLIKDKSGRNRLVLKLLHEFGASEEILYDYKPHIGTDVLMKVVSNISAEIIRCGGEIYYDCRVDEFQKENGRLSRLIANNGQLVLDNHPVILAIGHSARDTFHRLADLGLKMEPKPFAVGFRVEHPAGIINESQYGFSNPGRLGNATYKLTHQCADRRGVYSFCMCPGGFVVNASSEEGRLAINGMSYSRRDADKSNSAIIITINPEDYGDGIDPLSGVRFQRELEEKAFRLGSGRIPIECYSEFKSFKMDECIDIDSLSPSIKGGFKHALVHELMPRNLAEDFVEGMEAFGRSIKGFNNPDTLVMGIESRTSSPLRMLRDESCQSNLKLLYPAGEGAGYAGGITSAAMDGILVASRVAQGILKKA